MPSYMVHFFDYEIGEGYQTVQSNDVLTLVEEFENAGKSVFTVSDGNDNIYTSMATLGDFVSMTDLYV